MPVITLLIIFSTCFSFWVALSNAHMYKLFSKVDGQWIHLVLNFMGRNDGFQAFKDGALVPGQVTTDSFHRSPGDGRLAFGRRYPNTDDFYSSVDLNEMVFINRKLTEPEWRQFITIIKLSIKPLSEL